MHPQTPHGLCQVGVGDGVVDGFIEPADKPVVSVACGIGTADEPRRRQQIFVEFPENCSVAPLGSQRGRLPLECLAELKQFIDVLKRDIGDDDAATPGSPCQTFCAQSAKGLPQRSSGYAKPLGLFDFSQNRSRQESPLQNFFTEGLIGPFTSAHAVNVYTAACLSKNMIKTT